MEFTFLAQVGKLNVEQDCCKSFVVSQRPGKIMG